MHKVSRTLMIAGVLAFGSLAAACGDKVELVAPVQVNEVTSVTVSPSNATVNIGQTITLAANVVASGTAARTVTWTSSNAAVATVNATTGVVTGVSAGTATILATSTGDASKVGAAAVVVNATAPTIPPSLGINSVTQFGVPVNLSNTAGQIDVTLNISNTSGGAGSVEVFLSTNCTTNTISASDVSVATQQVTAGQAGTVTLSFNTAQLTAANAPRFANGNYCIKSRLTSGNQSVVATNLTPITLNNTNVFRGTLSFASANGGTVTSAVSTLNGLQYNQGNLTVTITPAIFTTASPVALVSGYLTRNGEIGGVNPVPAPSNAIFNNIAVTNGVATITFMDTLGTPAARSLYQYTSLPAGDTLYITAATDAAGNQVSVPANQFIVLGGNGVRIDNDSPLPAAAYTVTAPNGYIGAAYSFASGTTGAAADTKGGINGVGGVTTQYYVGPAGGTVFNGSAATLCSTTGLQLVTSGTDLPNTNSITPDQAKVIVTDALGNKTCAIVGVTTITGSTVTFGVDKVAPLIAIVPPNPANAPVGFSNNNGAADLTGYNVSKNFSFVYTDSISSFTNGVVLTPLSGTLTKNFFTAGVNPIGDCVIGTWVGGTTRTCTDTLITPQSSLTTGANAAPFNVNSIEVTTPQQAGRGTVGTPGYYRFSGKVTDLAGNVSSVVSRLVAFDNVLPTIGALTQSPAAAVPVSGSVTVTGTAADNLDLTSTSGSLSYPTVTPAPFAAVAGTSFGPNFDATTVTSAPASVTLTNVYRGMQNTSGANVILAGGVAPAATVTVTDVGTNVSAASPALTITTSTTKADILVGNTFVGTASVGAAPATRQASTTINVNVTGLIADPAFQNQPFAVVEIYKLTGGALVFQSSTASPLVTDAAPNRTYSYAITGVALSNAAANTFYAIGRNTAGDAVISQAITVTNP